MKTVIQALRDELIFPISYGKAENIALGRGFDTSDVFNTDIMSTDAYKGALADCLYALLQAVNFSEADKSVGALTDAQRKAILKQANDLYEEIGEPKKEMDTEPKVIIISDGSPRL